MFTNKDILNSNIFRDKLKLCEFKKYEYQDRLNSPTNFKKYWVNLILYDVDPLFVQEIRLLSEMVVFDLYDHQKFLLKLTSRSFSFVKNIKQETKNIEIVACINEYSQYSKPNEDSIKNILNDKQTICGEYHMSKVDDIDFISSSDVYRIKLYINVQRQNNRK